MIVARFKVDQLVAATCALVLASTLTAGLWPFHAPRNQTAWLKNGLLLGRHGTALGTAAFTSTSSPDDAGRTVEVWIQPARANQSGTILAFYQPGEQREFSLYQSGDGLALQTDLKAAQRSYSPARLAFLPHVFHRRPLVFVTIASGPSGTAVYINGAWVKLFSDFRPGDRAFAGWLVLGNSPVENDGWPGLWRGLAIYDRELTAADVAHHYQNWSSQQQPDIGDGDRAAAVYLFNEGSGYLLHNRVRTGIDLRIPANYLVLDEKFLEPAWKEFRWAWNYFKNVLINIAGFVPLGFFFRAYFSSTRKLRHATLVTVIVGTATSLTIEILQSFLPTRDSGTTDLVTNTLGTYLGVMLYRWKPALILQTLDRLPFLKRVA